MQTNFFNLTPDAQTIFLTIPMYLPATENPDEETEQQAHMRQDRFLRLPKPIRFKLASFDIGFKIEAIGKKYNFDLARLSNITRLIREYYFGEVKFEDFPKEIEKRMGVSLLTAQEITRYIKQEIINWDPWGEYIAKFPKMTTRDIIQQNPKLADMEITSGYVELKNTDELSDPTIKNWIKDYVSHLGYEKHSQMERTEYLFRSVNGKNLSSPDREKLGIILKSFDENLPLPVDEENNEIVFEGVEGFGSRVEHSTPAPLQPGYQQKNQNLPEKEGFRQTSQISFINPYPQAKPSTESMPHDFHATATSVNIAAPIRSQQKEVRRPAETSTPKIINRPSPFGSNSEMKARPIPSHHLVSLHDDQLDTHFSTREPAPTIPARPISQPEQKSEINHNFFTEKKQADAPIKIQSFTEHVAPKKLPFSAPKQAAPQKSSPTQPEKPKHRIINPFGDPLGDPRIEGNIVDLSQK